MTLTEGLPDAKCCGERFDKQSSRRSGVEHQNASGDGPAGRGGCRKSVGEGVHSPRRGGHNRKDSENTSTSLEPTESVGLGRGVLAIAGIIGWLTGVDTPDNVDDIVAGARDEAMPAVLWGR